MGKTRRSKYTKPFEYKVKSVPEKLEEPQLISDGELISEPVVLEHTEQVPLPPVMQVVLQPTPKEVVPEPVPEPVKKPTEVQVIPKPTPKPRPQQQNVLNALLNTILTSEYQRLQQQLFNIKQQIDANQLPVESTNKDIIDV